MKKLKKFKRRGPKEQPSGETTEEHQIGQMLFLRKPRPPLQTNVNGTPGFLCGECGRGFEKVKSRSAHMKMHRHHEQSWPGPVAGMAEPPL
ncbi:zinc finger protein 541-like [Denticeps clupeoides]|uniref:zinc finger protein 541-like n=1 Tax=Denticeps clupeoides TaxID=299321 RepID=UPI0010A39CD3|nr:zinc finger protein 541-like [Denticeps clupeoides]XP_028839129.1 zinc finger protein 541-like [Denticeps clupeoides]